MYPILKSSNALAGKKGARWPIDAISDANGGRKSAAAHLNVAADGDSTTSVIFALFTGSCIVRKNQPL